CKYEGSMGIENAGEQLNVWGNVTQQAEQLLAGLTALGWAVQTRGWPQRDNAMESQSGRVQLLVVDGDYADHVHRLPAVANSFGVEWVLIGSEQTLQQDVTIRSLLANSAYAYHCLPGDASNLHA